MKTTAKILVISLPLLLGSCGTTHPSGGGGPFDEVATRKEVLKLDAERVKREASMFPIKGRLPCTDTPIVEMKRITTPSGLRAERWIVTHPKCNITSVYYTSRKEVEPGVYASIGGTAFPE